MSDYSNNSVSQEIESPQEAIRSERDRVLNAGAFPRSPRLSRFLEFVVEEELADRGTKINGTQIAIDVYDRDSSFDPQIDPVVRVEARRLRRTLEHYYLTDGVNNAIHIDIPKGSYRPVFKNLSKSAEKSEKPRIDNISQRLEDLPPVPEGPIIAVLPFHNLDDSPSRDYFSDGFAGALTTALSRFDVIQVIAQQSTAKYHDNQVDVRVAGRELGARFILEGSVQRVENQIRVTAALSEADLGKELWSENFDRDMQASDLFHLEDELTQSVIGLITDVNGIIMHTIIPDSRDKPIQDLETYEAILRFIVYLNQFRSEDFLPAKEAIESALERDPDQHILLSGLSMLYAEDYLRGITPDKGPSEKAWKLANKTTTLAPNSASAHVARAIAAFTRRRADIAIKEAEKTISLNPNNATLGGLAGHVIGLSGELDKGIDILNRLKSLNPYYPSWLLSLTCLSHYMKGEYDQALSVAEQFTLDQWPGKPFYLAINLGQLGRTEEAAKQLAILKKIEPDFAKDPADYVYRQFLFDDQIEKTMDGLKKAGL